MQLIRMLVALAAAAPLAAQQPDTARKHAMPMGRMGPMMRMHGKQPGMMEHMMGMGMMEPMMRGMAFNPEHLLSRKDALELTPQQVTRLTALRDAMKTAHEAAHTEMRTHMEALSTAMKAATPDTNSMKQHFQAMQQAMGRAHWSMLSAAAQARGALTELQRGRVEGWVDAMRMHMGQMGEMRRRQAGPGHEEHHPERN